MSQPQELQKALENLVKYCQKYQEHILTEGEIRARGIDSVRPDSKCVVMCMNFHPVVADDLTKLLTAFLSRLNSDELITSAMEEEIVTLLRTAINHVRELRVERKKI